MKCERLSEKPNFGTYELRNHAGLCIFSDSLSQPTEVEVVAAVRRKGRSEGLHPSYMDALVNMFERHLALSAPERRSPIYRVIPLTSTTTSLAASLCNRYWNMDPLPLRSLDAIQLASALTAVAGTEDEVILSPPTAGWRQLPRRSACL
ncbi:MAG: type II toxin-antitoxin system VapC family toxin [Ktedonobacterales bacterium]